MNMIKTKVERPAGRTAADALQGEEIKQRKSKMQGNDEQRAV